MEQNMKNSVDMNMSLSYYLSLYEEITPETIKLMVKKYGFKTVQSLLFIDFERDFKEMVDIKLYQKIVLRAIIQKLKKTSSNDKLLVKKELDDKSDGLREFIDLTDSDVSVGSNEMDLNEDSTNNLDNTSVDVLTREKRTQQLYLLRSQSNRRLGSSTSVKSYTCIFRGCGKSFGTKPSLKQHLKRHDEKRFKCNATTCNKAFITKHELESHLSRKHPGLSNSL